MKRLVLATVLVALLAVTLTVAACGGKDVPAGAIAAVGDDGVVTQEQFDAIMTQAKAQYEASGYDFPEEGSATYDRLVGAIVASLVQTEVVTQQAKEMGVSVSDEDFAERMDQTITSVGGEKKFKELLKQYSMTREQAEAQIRVGMLTEAVQQKVYEGVEISDEKVKAYFEDPENAAQFSQAETRDTRHVLVKTKAEAEEVRDLLAADPSDANWKKVAKEYSTDPGTKDNGGSLGPISKGDWVASFEKATWGLDVDEISVPVKSQYGWHVIQVTKVTPASSQTFDEAKESIRQMLLYQKQSTAWTDWLEQAKKDAEVVYAAGFDPDILTASPEAEASPSASATE